MKERREKMKKAIAVLLAALLMLPALCLAEDTASQWQNILLMGGDARSAERYDRTDSIMILSLNAAEAQVKMTSIMRDTWVKAAGKGYSCKINALNVYGGPELTVATVNECFGTDIEKYVLINMTDMIDIIDLVGGVDVEITTGERWYINSSVKGYGDSTQLEESGLVHLNGSQALAYSRIRHLDSDFKRVERQQKVMLALAARLQEMEIGELMDLTDEIIGHLQTNLSEDEMKELARMVLVIEPDEVQAMRLPADGTFTSGTEEGKGYIIQPNFERNGELLQVFIYGD